MSGDIIVPTDLDAIAERVRQRIRRTTTDIIETGRDLLVVREKLEHGQFTDWLDTEFGMSDRSAQLYMRAAEWAEGKTEMISDLSSAHSAALM